MSSSKGWLSLFRPPNLFTVPGDPLVGTLLAALALGLPPNWNQIYAVLGATLAFYASGLLANDYFDRFIDAIERPDRPIPSGAVNPTSVKWWAILLSVSGLLLTLPAGRTASMTGVMLMVAIWFYNAIGKNIAWLAPVSMGICRGLSLMMGAAVLGIQGIISIPVIIAAAFITLYVALITFIARYEADPEAAPIPDWSRWSIPIILTAGLLLLIVAPWSPAPVQWKSLTSLMSAMSILWATVWIYHLKPDASTRVVQASIAGLIRGLLFTQAALCATHTGAGEGFALLLLFLFPVSGWIGKWFYGS